MSSNVTYSRHYIAEKFLILR